MSYNFRPPLYRERITKCLGWLPNQTSGDKKEGREALPHAQCPSRSLLYHFDLKSLILQLFHELANEGW